MKGQGKSKDNVHFSKNMGWHACGTAIFASLWDALLWQEILPLGSWPALALIVPSGVISLRAAPKLPAV